jgi:hypothetical protein
MREMKTEILWITRLVGWVSCERLRWGMAREWRQRNEERSDGAEHSFVLPIGLSWLWVGPTEDSRHTFFLEQPRGLPRIPSCGWG